MKLKHYLLCALVALTAFNAAALEKLFVLDKGLWQSDNGCLSYFENGAMVSNQLFLDVNKQKLGDTPNDIIQISDHLFAIAVNGSSLVQFIDETGKAMGTSGEIANVRYLASDGKYVYATSYAHTCATVSGTMDFTRGFVAKIDIATKETVTAVEVGYEPESLVLYNGRLFVANSGGYSYSESHDYEQTVSVVDPETMKVVRTVDTGKINLYGQMALLDNYLCISSCGDYYSTPACTVLLDCDAVLAGKPDADCVRTLPSVCTFCTAGKDCFYTVGSTFNYTTSQNTFEFNTIRPAEVFSNANTGVTATLPGTMCDDIKKMKQPNFLYMNPYTGYFYATDAGDYTTAGYLYQWDPEGKFLGSYRAYICPENMVALPPDGHFGGVEDIVIDRPAADDPDAPVYNLQGIPVTDPVPGHVYIRNGRKFILR